LIAGETRVVPVKAQINNLGGILKPGMFAELEVLTDQTSAPSLAIPNSAVVDVNGKKQVYIQNGNAYQPVEVTLGQTSGDMVAVKTGLFAGDLIVTQRAPQLYAQSLRGGGKAKQDEHSETPVKTTAQTQTPYLRWLLGVGGVAVTAVLAFVAGAFWNGRYNKSQQLVLVGNSSELDPPVDRTENYHNNYKSPVLSSSTTDINEREDPHFPKS